MRKSFLFLSVAGLLALTACNKWVDTDINIDPNNPKDVPLELILPGAQAAWSYTYGGDICRYNSVVTQHHGGVDRQHLGIDAYNITEVDVNNSWESTYATAMNEFNIIIQKAGNESPHYSGIARVLMAHALMVTTDLYGDIPYSDAFQLGENLKPGYDNQKDIYAAIVTMLTEATTDLAAAESVFSPGGDDLMYGGDMALWGKAANALLARAYLHSANVNNGDYAKALAALDKGSFSGSVDDLNMFYTTVSTEQNPLYQFVDQRGDIRMGKFFIDLMVGLDDPRLSVFAVPADSTGYRGSPAGKPDISASMPGAAYNAPDAPIPFVTYVEQKFIEAEAALKTGDKLRAATAHNEAVSASLAQWGVSNAAYLAANAAETDATISLEKIMTQKYIALYYQTETWTDWRRTGYPELSPAVGQSRIPTKWPMSQSERFYNADNYNLLSSPIDIYAKVWWDAD